MCAGGAGVEGKRGTSSGVGGSGNNGRCVVVVTVIWRCTFPLHPSLRAMDAAMGSVVPSGKETVRSPKQTIS